MNKSKLHNLTDKLIHRLNQQDRSNIMLAYRGSCRRIGVGADNIYAVKDPSNPTFQDVKYTSSFITICRNLGYIFETIGEVDSWFRRGINRLPFSGRSPLEVIQSGKQGMLEVRLYTNMGKAIVEFRK